MHPHVARTRALVAVAHRRGNPEEIACAQRDLAAAKLEDYIRRTVDAAPPLSESQRDRLVAVLRGSSNSGGAAA